MSSTQQQIDAINTRLEDVKRPNDLSIVSEMPTGAKVMIVDPVATTGEVKVVTKEVFADSIDSTKLDKDGYTGTAQDLKDNIDSINFNGVKVYDTLAEAQAVTPTPLDYNGFSVDPLTDPTNAGQYYYLASEPNGTKFYRDFALTQSDIVLDLSPNLAKSVYLVYDEFIASNGQKFAGAGWVMLKIPVTNNQAYTFGNFTIDSAGYSAFYNDADNLVQNNPNHTNATLPRTVSATSVNAKWLYIVIARPSNDEIDWSRTIVNEGSTLIEYVEPIDYIESIGGYSVKAGGIEDGTDASLGALTVQALTLDIPQGSGTPPVQVETGDAWIDTSDNNAIKVKLS